MNGGLGRLVEGIRASFWFVPALMTTGAMLLALLTVRLDQGGTSAWLDGLGFVYLNRPDGARALLSTIAGSMMNVAGVVFSLTMVTLTLASQQFGPRLLGNFMRDRGNQLVLGAFVSTFLYCLLILRTVQAGGEGEPPFVPHLSVAVAMLITLVTLASLIYFIHHIAASIQVQNVIDRVATALRRHVAPDADRGIFPGHAGRPLERAVRPGELDVPMRSVAARRAGYVQTIDGHALVRLARRHGAIVRLHVRPGVFVMHGATVMSVHPPDLPDEPMRHMANTLSYGAGRGQSDDPDALFDQLLELGLRALSPTSNNPITANACVDWICDGLLDLGRGELPAPYRADDEGALRLVTPPFDITDLAERLLSSLRSGLASNLLSASHAVSRLEQVRLETLHAGLADVVDREREELLRTCRETMTASDLRTLEARTARRAGPGEEA